MTIYRVYEKIEIKEDNKAILETNSWIASFQSQNEAEEYMDSKGRTDYENDQIKKSHYIASETY